jgi:hypothetical protein
MAKKIRVGTAIRALIGSRLRHTIVETVTDQDTLTVRLGKNSDQTLVNVARDSSTKTRGTLFEEVP